MEKKPYLIEGVVGNSRLLASLGSKGQLYRLFWPNIDFPQHIHEQQAGIIMPGRKGNTLWLNDAGWQVSQNYLPNTNVLKTVYLHKEYGLQVACTDFVPVDEDLLIRAYEIENLAETTKQVLFLYYSSFQIADSESYNSVIFDRGEQGLVHFRHDYAFAVGSNRKASGFQCGHSWDAVQHGHFNNQDVCPLGDGSLKWDLGLIEAHEKITIPIFIGCGRGVEEALWQLKRGKAIGTESFLQKTTKYWQGYLQRGKELQIKDPTVKELYNRSLLTLALMQDQEYGGIIAAPEFDEKFSRCGGYGFCWGRDAAFITRAFDEAGYHKETRKFYKWAIRAQSQSGVWLQRHYMNGKLAPTWGMQIDETGSILWGAWQHFQETKDIGFLREFWPYMVKGADFLSEYINPHHNLPDGSYDLWEERFGLHAYSTAAVIAGLKASVESAKVLDQREKVSSWQTTATRVELALAKLWRPSLYRYVRSLNGSTYQYEDHEVDISLLGLSIPFLVLEPGHENIVKMVEVLEEHLTSINGGIKRYVHDTYIGGNPWILCTLWLAQYYVAVKQNQKAKELLQWVTKHRTKLFLLPEQIHKETGEPAWVIPLTWSHAMYILTVIGLAEASEI